MSLQEILDQLRQLSTRTYSYMLLAAVFGPLTLRILGLSSVAQLVRPAALALLLGGIYARQQGGAASGETSSR